MSELTGKQARFVEEYLVDLNATQAAIRAGYSARTARQIGEENLSKPVIAEAVAEAQRERSQRTNITQDRVLAELAKIGFANLSDVTKWGQKEVAFGYTEDGKRLAAEDIGDAVKVEYVLAPFVEPVNCDQLAPDLQAAVSEVKLGREGFSIKMHDKLGALEKLGRHLGMFTDNVNLNGRLTIDKALASLDDDG